MIQLQMINKRTLLYITVQGESFVNVTRDEVKQARQLALFVMALQEIEMQIERLQS